MTTDPNHDIVPTLRMFDGVMMGKAADEIEALRARVLAAEELLRSARVIAQREGVRTNWARFDASIAQLGIGYVTARTYRVLPSDEEQESQAATAPPESSRPRSAENEPTDLDSLALYKRVCDIWAEAAAVDTIIGRHVVLMAKLTSLRDELGAVRTSYIPRVASPAAGAQAATALTSPSTEDTARGDSKEPGP